MSNTPDGTTPWEYCVDYYTSDCHTVAECAECQRRLQAVQSLECSCCGGDGAYGDAHGLFYDGQPLVCGCVGHVCVEEDDIWVNASECDCER